MITFESDKYGRLTGRKFPQREPARTEEEWAYQLEMARRQRYCRHPLRSQVWVYSMPWCVCCEQSMLGSKLWRRTDKPKFF